MDYEKLLEHILRLDKNEIELYGSNEIGDWIINLDCLFNKEGFHSGAYKASLYLYELYKNKLEKEKTVILKGHSLGASIVSVLGYHLDKDGFDVEINTIGGFPVANKKRAKETHLKGKVRYHGNDVVTKLFPFKKQIVKIVNEGSKRKWWKISFKDHVSY